MPPRSLHIRLTRRTDDAVVFELRRPDGSTTWQRREGPTADFFAVHDLTHYAVERVLGVPRGFYGLVAEGWDLGDFGKPWPKGPLPGETLAIEVIVGCFDSARAAAAPLTAEQCNTSGATYFAAAGKGAPIPVTDPQLDAVRAIISDVVGRWYAVRPGETMELTMSV